MKDPVVGAVPAFSDPVGLARDSSNGSNDHADAVERRSRLRRLHKPQGAIWRRPWFRFAVRRGRRLLISIGVLVTASFLMVHFVPGDPVRAALGDNAPQSLVDDRRQAMGLNDPLWLQYVNYVRHVSVGDWGSSLRTNLPVADIIGDRLPSTLMLAGLAFAATIAIAIPLGMFMSAINRGGRRPRTELGFTTTSIVVDAIPGFVLTVVLVAIFGVGLGWLPVAGKSNAYSYLIPVAALSAAPIAMMARIVRVEMLSVLESDYIRTARAKRLSAFRIYARHALPNALTATLTLAGLLLSGLVAGTVFVENVLAWPGLGTTIVSSILTKDYPVVQGVVLVYGLLVLTVNLVVDILLAKLDPRSTLKRV